MYYMGLVVQILCSILIDMAKILDRTEELAGLETAWKEAADGRPQLAVVWGRRRVGKTFLLSHFVRGKRAVFFGATQQAEGIELRRLDEALRRDLGTQAADLSAGGFPSWEAALRFFVAMSGDEPLVVVLDEVPYLARSTPGLPSIIQAVWDHVPAGTKLLLVLTGSAVGFIEEMLGAGGALRGRPTSALRLDPVDLLSARAFLPRLNRVPFFEAYSACGGYPLHLLQWDQEAGTEENLVRLAGQPGGMLLDDANAILREELPEAGGYPRILAAIGRGRTRPSTIASEADQRIEHPLEVLVRAGFVRKSRPVGAPRRARAIYEIADAYLAFWFGVLYSDLPEIETGQGRAVLKRRRPAWERHLGWMFEETARDHARRMVARGELPDDLVVGRWWTTTGEPAEVDVLGLRGSRTALIGEARWQEQPPGSSDVQHLRDKLTRVPRPIDDSLLALWSRARSDERDPRTRTFDLRQMLQP